MSDPRAPVNPMTSAFWTALTTLIQRGTLHQEAIADALGLNLTDLRCVGYAWTEPDLTPGRLAELTGLTTGAVTGVLDRLERAGFVQRVGDPADRRRTLVRVSQSRGEELGATYDPLERAIEAIVGRLDPRALTTITDVMGRVGSAVERDTERLRASSRGGMVGDMFTAPVHDLAYGRLAFRSGAPRLALRAAPLGPENEVRAVAELTHTTLRLSGQTADGELCRASFDGPRPDVTVRKGDVAINYKRRPDWRQREARVGLSPRVPWDIAVSGGLSTLDADLRTLRLRELSVSGSIDDVKLLLGRPDGTSRIRVSGGSRDVTVEVPTGIALRLSVSGGAKDVRFEREHLRNIHGSVRLETRETPTAPDRFEVDLSGGTRSVKVHRA